MKSSIKTELIRIGNSRGIRIPKALIEQCKFGDTVLVSIEGGGLMITADRQPREGWEGAFQADAAHEELLLEPAPANRFDDEDWEW